MPKGHATLLEPSHDAGSEPNDRIEWGEMLRGIWRRKWWVLAMVALGTGTVAWERLDTPPIYKAVAQVVAVNEAPERVVKMDSVVPAVEPSEAALGTQVNVLQSEALASKVVRILHLEEDPDFNYALAPEDRQRHFRLGDILRWLDPRAVLPSDWMAWLRELKSTIRPSRTVSYPAEKSRSEAVNSAVLGRFRSGLSVSPVPNSWVINIEYADEDPDKAALIANTVAEAFIADQVQRKVEATQRAAAWLATRLDELRGRVAEAEAAVEAYRERAGLIAGRDGTVVSQQFSELNRQLAMVSNERMRTEAKQRQFARLREQGGNLEAVPEVLSSPVIQSLRQQEAALALKLADASTRYGDSHPTVLNYRASLDDVDRKIKAQAARIAMGIQSEVDSLRSSESALRDEMARLEQQTAENGRAEIRLRELQREADAMRSLYQTMLVRVQEAREQEGLQRPDGKVIARALPPASPSSPRTTVVLGGALVGSLLLGLALALLLEKMDRRLRRPSEAAAKLGLPVIGLVPSLGRIWPLRGPPNGPPAALSDARYHEAIRTIHATPTLHASIERPKIVMVTSSVPREGKSTLCLSLARQMAWSGLRCLLVDCDFRRPTLHSQLDQPFGAGMTDLLKGSSTIEDVVRTDRHSNLDFIPAGDLAKVGAAMPGTYTDPISSLLQPERVQQVLDQLAERYDVIVVDTPPVMAVADARILSRHASKTIMVARWGATPRSTVLASLAQLLDAGADVAGVVLTQVNLRHYARYATPGEDQFSYKYRSYYYRAS